MKILVFMPTHKLPTVVGGFYFAPFTIVNPEFF